MICFINKLTLCLEIYKLVHYHFEKLVLELVLVLYAFFRPKMRQKLFKINYTVQIDKLKPESSSCAGDP